LSILNRKNFLAIFVETFSLPFYGNRCIIVKVSLKPEMAGEIMKYNNNTNEKSIIDIILRLMKYIRFIYICEFLLRLIEKFN